jgi:hypothetical protein
MSSARVILDSVAFMTKGSRPVTSSQPLLVVTHAQELALAIIPRARERKRNRNKNRDFRVRARARARARSRKTVH